MQSENKHFSKEELEKAKKEQDSLALLKVTEKSGPALKTEEDTIVKISESDTLINFSHNSEKEMLDVEFIPCRVHVSYVESYCGGAYPSEEILKEYEKQSPLANTHLILKNKKGKRITVKTNAKGVFEETLADGRYSVFMTKNVSPSSPVSFDPSCDVWLKSEFAQFTVKANEVLEREIILYFSCKPCLPPRP